VADLGAAHAEAMAALLARHRAANAEAKDQTAKAEQYAADAAAARETCAELASQAEKREREVARLGSVAHAERLAKDLDDARAAHASDVEALHASNAREVAAACRQRDAVAKERDAAKSDAVAVERDLREIIAERDAALLRAEAANAADVGGLRGFLLLGASHRRPRRGSPSRC